MYGVMLMLYSVIMTHNMNTLNTHLQSHKFKNYLKHNVSVKHPSVQC